MSWEQFEENRRQYKEAQDRKAAQYQKDQLLAAQQGRTGQAGPMGQCINAAAQPQGYGLIAAIKQGAEMPDWTQLAMEKHKRELREYFIREFIDKLYLTMKECHAPEDSQDEIVDKLLAKLTESHHEEAHSGTDRPHLEQGGRGPSSACEGRGKAHDGKDGGRSSAAGIIGGFPLATVNRRGDWPF